MNSTNTVQHYKHYMSTFGKKVLGNLIKNLGARNECNKSQLAGLCTYGRCKQVLNFGDSYIYKKQNVIVNESHKNILDNNILSCTNTRDGKSPVITTSHGLLKATFEDVVTEEGAVHIGTKTNAYSPPGTGLPGTEECNNGRTLDNTHVVKGHIEWDDIFDTQLLNDLSMLNTDPNIKAREQVTDRCNSVQSIAEYESDLCCNKINMKTATGINMNNNINSDNGNTSHTQTTKHLPHPNTIEYNASGSEDIKANKIKRSNPSKITNVTPKKIKKPSAELPKNSFRKQKYTRAVKTWLTNVENEKIQNVTELTSNKEMTVEEIKSNTSELQKKKNTRKTVQAQLTNKGGVMKYGAPKQNDLLENLKDIDYMTKINVSDAGTVKEKKTKHKFIAPVKSQIPVKDISYNIVNLNDDNFNEHVTELGALNVKEINMILIFSNGFCQLNSHFAEGGCTVEGVMFQVNSTIYYWKHVYKTLCGTMERIINHNPIVCYDGKNLLKHFASQGINVISTEVNLLDLQIGGILINPNNPPENFTHLQKILSFVPEYTIITECVQQKCAWYLTTLGECFVRLRALLIDYELWKVFVGIEMRVLPIVADMEQRGVRVDVERLQSMEDKLVRRMRMTERACHAAAGRAFQPHSALQVRNILYGELRLDVRSNVRVRETLCKGDKSTSETTLRGLMALHPLPELILEYRHVHKAHATFLAGIANQVKDGIVRPTWEQTAAVTGRVACNNPNLQAIPKAPFSLVLFPADSADGEHSTERHETLNFRSVYVPREGHVLLAADFKHIECRVFAYVAGDTSLLDALASPDLFRVLAAKWLNKSEEDVGSEDRERTKRIVYASLYGAGSRRLMEILGLSYDQTLSVAASFNRTFPSLKSFGRAVVAKCEQRGGRLATPCGRGRTFPNISSADLALRSQAERQAINFIVQGSAADLCKMAMAATTRRLRDAEPPVRGHLLLQIHDELVWEVPLLDVGRAAAEIKLAMEGVGRSCGIDVPLPVAIFVGRTWGEMEPFIPTP